MGIIRLLGLIIKFASWATPHVKRLNNQRQAAKQELEHYFTSSNWTESERFFKEKLKEPKLADTIKLDILLGLARAQREQKKYEEASQTANTALELAKHLREYESHVASLREIGEIYTLEGRDALALETFQEIVRQESARSHPDLEVLAIQTRKIGHLLAQQGRAEDAQFALERSVALSEKKFGLNHRETANSLAVLGAFQRQIGEHIAAQKNLRQAIEVHRATVGRDSPEVANDLYHLSASLEESGDLQGAISEYERVLTAHERQVGNNPAEFAMCKVRLAALYLQDERSSAARELLQHALRVIEKMGGEQHLLVLQLLICAEEQANRLVEAQKYRVRAEKLTEKLEQAKAKQVPPAPPVPQVVPVLPEVGMVTVAPLPAFPAPPQAPMMVAPAQNAFVQRVVVAEPRQ